jgi:hypothetical protein
MEWRKNEGTNEVLDMGDFFISFNPEPMPDSSFASDDGGPETAICIKGSSILNRRFFILNGDFRKEYEARAPQGLKACMDFWRSKPDLHSSWSDQEADLNEETH